MCVNPLRKSGYAGEMFLRFPSKGRGVSLPRVMSASTRCSGARALRGQVASSPDDRYDHGRRDARRPIGPQPRFRRSVSRVEWRQPYGLDGNIGNSTEVMRLDPTTAAVMSTLGVGLTGTFGEGDLAFNSGGTGYVAATGFPNTGGFYSFDITGPSSHTIKSPGPVASNIGFDGIAFDASDVLYGLQQGGGNLYTLNPATGAPTLVGPTGITGLFGLGGLTFGSDGTLYGVLATSTTSNLYSFNPATGAGTLIGAVTNGLDPNGSPKGVGKLDGIAFLGATAPPPPVPEPATLLMMGSGLGLGYWRRRHALRRRGSRYEGICFRRREQ